MKKIAYICLWLLTPFLTGAAQADDIAAIETAAANAVKAGIYLESINRTQALPKLSDTTEGGNALNMVCDVAALDQFPTINHENYGALGDWATSVFKTLIVYGKKAEQQGEDSPSTSEYATEFGECIDASLVIGANLANSAARFLAADPGWGNNKTDGFTFESIQNMNFGTISNILKMAHTNAPQPSWTKDRLEVMKTVLPYALPVISEQQCNVLYWRAKSASPNGSRAEKGEENISDLFTCATWDIK